MKGKGWDYVDTVSLSMWRQKNFKPKYGGCRDVGYCFTLDTCPSLKLDGSIANFYDIKWALWNLNGLYQAIEEAQPSK